MDATPTRLGLLLLALFAEASKLLTLSAVRSAVAVMEEMRLLTLSAATGTDVGAARGIAAALLMLVALLRGPSRDGLMSRFFAGGSGRGGALMLLPIPGPLRSIAATTATTSGITAATEDDEDNEDDEDKTATLGGLTPPTAMELLLLRLLALLELLLLLLLLLLFLFTPALLLLLLL